MKVRRISFVKPKRTSSGDVARIPEDTPQEDVRPPQDKRSIIDYIQEFKEAEEKVPVNKTIYDAINLFIADRKARGMAQGTMYFYLRNLGRFKAACEREGIEHPEEITSEFVRQFLIDVASDHNPGGTHAFFRSVKAFLRWYWNEYEPKIRNPIERIKPPKVPTKPLPGIPLKDITAILETISGPYRLRDTAIVLTLLDTGVRAMELAHLNVGDMDDTGALIVRMGKGNKQRTVFLGQKSKIAVRRYLRERGNLRTEQPLFAMKDGMRYSYEGLRSLVRYWATKAGVPEPGLHDFRRTFCLTMHRNGTDIVTLSRLMGHSSLEVLKRYLDQNEEDYHAAHNKASPVDMSL